MAANPAQYPPNAPLGPTTPPIPTPNPGASQPTPSTSNTGGKVQIMDWETKLQGGNTDALQREVQDNETVEKRLNDLTASNSKYIRNATTQANAQAADRGMLMSSVAAGAARRASIDAALPIAQQDANTYTQAARDNQAAVNADRLADQSMYGNLVGQEVGIRANLDEADRNRAWQSGENSAQRSWQSGENSADRASQASIAAANNRAQADMQAASLAFQKASQDADMAWRSGENALEREQQLQTLQKQQTFDAFQSQLNRDFQLSENEKAQAQQRFLQFENTLNTYNSQLMGTLSSIYSNPNLTASQQTAAANNARALHASLYDSYAATMSGGVPDIYWEPYSQASTQTPATATQATAPITNPAASPSIPRTTNPKLMEAPWQDVRAVI